MLKKKILIEKDIDIKKYSKLNNFIKNKHVGYQPKKAKVFSPSELNGFLKNAPNAEYLATKVNIYIFAFIYSLVCL